MPASRRPRAKRSFRIKLIGVAAAGVLVLGGGGTAGYMFLQQAPNTRRRKKRQSPRFSSILPDVLVNLSNSGNDRTQYLKVKITLELPNQGLVDKIKPLMPRVLDVFQTYLRELRPTDLYGSAGLYRLKEALTRRVNAAVAPAISPLFCSNRSSSSDDLKPMALKRSHSAASSYPCPRWDLLAPWASGRHWTTISLNRTAVMWLGATAALTRRVKASLSR